MEQESPVPGITFEGAMLVFRGVYQYVSNYVNVLGGTFIKMFFLFTPISAPNNQIQPFFFYLCFF